jgi:hypothetical protein
LSFRVHLIMELEILTSLAWKVSGLTLHNPRPQELDGNDGSTSGGFVMEAAVLARRFLGAARLSTANAGVRTLTSQTIKYYLSNHLC